jgi:hypothetical protein
MKIKYFLSISIISVLFIFTGCGDKKGPPMQKFVHENGIRLNIPINIKIEKTSNGFVVFPEGGRDIRSPVEVKISLENTERPDGVYIKTKTVHDKTIHYQTEENTGGSGGTEYLIRAWTPANKGHIYIEQLIQIEAPNTPDFDLFWTVVSGIE